MIYTETEGDLCLWLDEWEQAAEAELVVGGKR